MFPPTSESVGRTHSYYLTLRKGACILRHRRTQVYLGWSSRDRNTECVRRW